MARKKKRPQEPQPSPAYQSALSYFKTTLDDGTPVTLGDILIHLYCQGRTEPTAMEKYVARAYARKILGQ